MRVLVFFFVSLAGFTACKNTGTTDSSEADGTSDLKTLEAQVMAIHDEVMPKLNDINHLNAQLRRVTEGYVVTESERVMQPEGLEAVKESLKMAEHGMWDWMKSFNDTKETLTEDQLEAFYKSELTRINKVKTDILTSIEEAKAWIAAHPQPQQ